MFGELLNQLMQKKKINQKRLGKRSGVSQGNISWTVRGMVGYPPTTVSILFQVCLCFLRSLWVIMGIEEFN